jgi:predicted enzyme related to lactoylglutathione lyase
MRFHVGTVLNRNRKSLDTKPLNILLMEDLMSHPIVHIELSAENHEEMAKWYGQLFGWSTQGFPEMNYSTFSSGEGGVGGGFNPYSEGAPAGTIVPYVQCEDINGMIAKVESMGGKILLPPMSIPTVGQVAQFTDPSGNRMALLQPEESGM